MSENVILDRASRAMSPDCVESVTCGVSMTSGFDGVPMPFWAVRAVVALGPVATMFG